MCWELNWFFGQHLVPDLKKKKVSTLFPIGLHWTALSERWIKCGAGGRLELQVGYLRPPRPLSFLLPSSSLTLFFSLSIFISSSLFSFPPSNQRSQLRNSSGRCARLTREPIKSAPVAKRGLQLRIYRTFFNLFISHYITAIWFIF